MEWYIPITILPGIGFLILSTSNFLIALNEEIKEMEKENEKLYSVIEQKITQLKKLNYALIGQYIASFLLVLGGIIGEVFESKKIINYFVFFGIIILMTSIGLLIVYSVNALKVRQEHLKISKKV